MKFLAISILAFLMTITAQAEPYTVTCSGIAGGTYAIDVLFSFDGQDAILPSAIEANVNGEKVFSSSEISTEMVNVGTEEEPFINTAVSAKSASSSVYIRFPEQSPESPTQGLLDILIENGLEATEVLVTCQ